MGNGVNADPSSELVAGCSAKYASGRSDIVEYVTHLNDEYKAGEMPESVMREECESDCEPMHGTTDYRSVNRVVCKSCCEPMCGTTDCNNVKDTMLTLSKHTPNDLHGTVHGVGNVSYPKYPSGMQDAVIDVPNKMTEGILYDL